MTMTKADRLAAAYAHCEQKARSHYENFPVASHLLPKHLRQPIAVIYTFARTADDLADEGETNPAQRLQLLTEMANALDDITRGIAGKQPVFIALADVIEQHNLPVQLFHDLLSAFRQDVAQKHYADFAAVLDYCRRSANPVGRLLLHLQNEDSEQNIVLSDRVCTALQLINFYQDLAQDYAENQRIYIPQDEMQQYGITAEHYAEQRNDLALQQLMQLQYQRARRLMLDGAVLGQRLQGRFGLEIRLIIAGGLRILDKMTKLTSTDPFARPRLRRIEWPVLLWHALSSNRDIHR
ncbi:MAG: squalene synthase HpnC [Thiohalomonadaceae bacterium]